MKHYFSELFEKALRYFPAEREVKPCFIDMDSTISVLRLTSLMTKRRHFFARDGGTHICASTQRYERHVALQTIPEEELNQRQQEFESDL